MSQISVNLDTIKYNMDFPGSSAGIESACNADLSSISALGIVPGEGHGNPLQYSCLENILIFKFCCKSSRAPTIV